MEFVGRHISFLFRLHSVSKASCLSSSIQGITADDDLAVPN